LKDIREDILRMRGSAQTRWTPRHFWGQIQIIVVSHKEVSHCKVLARIAMRSDKHFSDRGFNPVSKHSIGMSTRRALSHAASSADVSGGVGIGGTRQPSLDVAASRMRCRANQEGLGGD
jgi:hypothetical protein